MTANLTSMPIDDVKLPTVNNTLFWTDSVNGLVVSPNCNLLPKLPSTEALSHVQNTPQLLGNNNIYQACSPRLPINRGPLFGRLDVTASTLYSKIVETGVRLGKHGDLKFGLPQDIMESWMRLEDALLDVITYLMKVHKDRRSFPALTLPKLPKEFGYRDFHRNRTIATRCALKSRDAFAALAGLVTFTLLLWLEPYRDTCFEEAFKTLTSRTNNPVHQQWLTLLEDSYVCNLSSGMRTGAFIDPYTCGWVNFIPKFVNASIPIWMIWGNEANYIAKRPFIHDRNVLKFLPSPSKIREMQNRAETGETYPSYNPTPLLLSQYEACDREQDRVLVSLASEGGNTQIISGQLPRETYPEFVARMEKAQLRRIAHESVTEKQSRESREAHAKKDGYAIGTTVFLWEDENGFWRRVKLDKSEVSAHWDDFTDHQRIYYGHANQWDLCPMLPRYPPGTPAPADYQPYEDFDDGVEDDFQSEYYSTAVDYLKDILAGMVDTPDDEQPSATVALHTNSPTYDTTFIVYLRMRHGFDATKNCKFQPSHHENRVGTGKQVLDRLCHPNENVDPALMEAFVYFYNKVIDPAVKFYELSDHWDIVQHRDHFSLNHDNIEVRKLETVQGKRIYIIRDLQTFSDDWMVAVHDPTVLLRIFRTAWGTLTDIVRNLLHHGIPFHMPRRIHRSNVTPPRRHKYRTRGLGSRRYGFEPTDVDFKAYKVERAFLFNSELGRAFRLRGGLVARMARDFVSEAAVLDGPVVLDEILVCLGGGDVLVEDSLTVEMLDIVCGVYQVPINKGGGSISHMSWWPQHKVWEKAGYDLGEWSPAAEVFYQKQLAATRNGEFVISTNVNWKAKVKRYVSHTRRLQEGSERLAESFLEAMIWNGR